MDGKIGNPNRDANSYIEIIPLPGGEVRIVYKEINDAGISTIIYDEKYKITESSFIPVSEESEAAEIIRTTMNLQSHQKLEKVEESQEA